MSCSMSSCLAFRLWAQSPQIRSFEDDSPQSSHHSSEVAVRSLKCVYIYNYTYIYIHILYDTWTNMLGLPDSTLWIWFVFTQLNVDISTIVPTARWPWFSQKDRTCKFFVSLNLLCP
jgi:hypothetical protein